MRGAATQGSSDAELGDEDGGHDLHPDGDSFHLSDLSSVVGSEHGDIDPEALDVALEMDLFCDSPADDRMEEGAAVGPPAGDEVPAPPPPDMPPGFVIVEAERRVAKAITLAVVVGPFGFLRYYAKKNQFVAECKYRAHANCCATKTADASRARGREGQGRPLGFLFAWMCAPPAAISRDAHVHVYVPGFEDRLRFRRAVEAQAATVPELAELFAQERPQGTDPSAEPAFVP